MPASRGTSARPPACPTAEKRAGFRYRTGSVAGAKRIDRRQRFTPLPCERPSARPWPEPVGQSTLKSNPMGQRWRASGPLIRGAGFAFEPHLGRPRFYEVDMHGAKAGRGANSIAPPGPCKSAAAIFSGCGERDVTGTGNASSFPPRRLFAPDHCRNERFLMTVFQCIASRQAATAWGIVLVLCVGCSKQGEPPSGGAAKHKPAPAIKQLVEEGKKLLMDGRKSQAVEVLTRAIAQDPKYKDAYSWRAVALSEIGRPQDALADYTKAIELDPNDAYLYDQRSMLYRNVLRDKEKAEVDKEKAFALRERQRDTIRDNVDRARNSKGGKSGSDGSGQSARNGNGKKTSR